MRECWGANYLLMLPIEEFIGLLGSPTNEKIKPLTRARLFQKNKVMLMKQWDTELCSCGRCDFGSVSSLRVGTVR